ncbi:hypothetical protein B0T26DRAFT_755062 [Lasiosphaeria miniovina]|uniref:2EXR domain-containing protein n=1 Tax=Lasiosphaeria miniovina TaxID=1954250 RepID=A0AA40A654_9PEZI|nr:uncharacterized protein B0T26DRAFT_755062 [Lasiosphaeria miniovina]KAK0709930.1 hypothetical protein B0T26DRAFT_755062 [Lasiosphaeria miniovina]
MSAMATTNGSPRFLAFPPEIRNSIYRLLLRHRAALMKGLHEKEQWSSYPVKLSAQLLRTCRQVRAEGLPILNGENTFKIEISNTKGPYYCSINSLEELSNEVYFLDRRPHMAERLPCLRRFEIEVRHTLDHVISIAG